MKFWKKHKKSTAPSPDPSAQLAQTQWEMNTLINTMMTQNSAILRRESINTAIDAERGILEMETLRQINRDLISTCDEVLEIQRNGREQRLQDERELRQLENDLYRKMLEVSTAQMNLSF